METAQIAQIIDEMGTLLELRGENPFRCPRLPHGGPGARQFARRSARDDRRRPLERGARHRRHDARQDRAARHDGALAVLRRAAAEHAAGPGRTLAHSGPGPEEDQGAARDAQDREPGRLAGGGRGRQDRRAQGLWRKDRGQDPRGDRLRREGRRADPPERRASAGRPDPRGGARPSPGDSRRGLRQPAPAGRDDRRSRHSVQLEARHRGARCVRQAAPGRHGAGPRADQGERPAGRRRAVRSARRRRRRSFRSPFIISRARRPTISRCDERALARGLDA